MWRNMTLSNQRMGHRASSRSSSAHSIATRMVLRIWTRTVQSTRRSLHFCSTMTFSCASGAPICKPRRKKFTRRRKQSGVLLFCTFPHFRTSRRHRFLSSEFSPTPFARFLVGVCVATMLCSWRAAPRACDQWTSNDVRRLESRTLPGTGGATYCNREWILSQRVENVVG